MGMDVSGRRPKAAAGKYFGANLSTWLSIYELMLQLCSDVVEEDTLIAMQFNDGHGPTGHKICNAMADRFEEWLEGRNGKSVRVPRRKGLLDRAVLNEWVTFLRNCGGFRVY